MIPIAEIEPENLYCSTDATWLLDDGTCPRKRREKINAACKAGKILGAKIRGKWWFLGKAFLDWVQDEFGEVLRRTDA